MPRGSSRTATVAVVALALSAAAGALVVNAPGAGAATLAFRPVADAYVESTNPTTNYGSSTRVAVDSSPARRAYFKFSVSGISGTVTSAKLRLHVRNTSYAASPNGGTLRSMSGTTWSETGVTWNNQPAIDGAALGSLGPVSMNIWYEFNVTSAVTRNGTFAFGLTSPAADAAYYDTREAGATAPQLVVTTAASTTTTLPPTTTMPPSTTVPPSTTTPPASDPVLVGAGDIAGCSSAGDEATAKLLDGIPGTVFTAGDNAYANGTATEFANCYGPSWGRHRARTRPSPGNHDHNTAGAAGYYGYFGANAGDPAKGYYSYDIGNWHVVAVNSSCSAVGGCGAGSPQERWLRADLAASTKPCTVAYWHHPLFTSGPHAPSTEMRPIFQALYDNNAEVVVSGHNHQYERFAPQTPSGALDTTRGVREFVAGMGGISHYAFGTIQPNSQARNSDAYGVLKLTLRANSYDWQFVPEGGKTYTDSGNTACH